MIYSYMEKESDKIRQKLLSIHTEILKFMKNDSMFYRNEQDEYSYIEGVLESVQKIINGGE